MAATDEQVVLSAARWADECYYLQDFVAKNHLPTLVKITKGHCGTIGVPTLANPGLQSTVVLIATDKSKKILAQAIKVKDGRRVISVGPKFAIPETYKGYFELLSEEGRAVRCIESVSELTKRRPENGCLVRDAIRGIVGRYTTEGHLLADSARIVNVGEVLFIGKEVQISNSKSKFLQCTDSSGKLVLLRLDQKCRFSAVAKEDNISGVHTVKNLLCKRLPLTVALVHGTPPRGLKSASHFVPQLRLLSTFEEDHIFALPLNKESNTLIALQLSTLLKLQKTKNEDHLKELNEYQNLIIKGTKLVGEAVDRAYVCCGKLQNSNSVTNKKHASPSKSSLLRRSMSADAAVYVTDTGHTGRRNSEYDEIDQIYDYIRGFAPLPTNANTFSDFNTSSSSRSKMNMIEKHTSTNNHNIIESSALTKAEKRTRVPNKLTVQEQQLRAHKQKTNTKLYVKNDAVQRKLNHSISLKDTKEYCTVGNNKTPVFLERYKSLNNLQQSMEMDDSSHSGDRTSGDSATGVKLPEKRTKRLIRPRSLTSLLIQDIPDVSDNKVCVDRLLQKTILSPNQKRIGTLYL